MTKTKILVIGASGMLGNAVFRYFADRPDREVTGAVRSSRAAALLPDALRERLVTGIDVDNFDSIVTLFDRVRPDVVINCIGLVKQLGEAKDPLAAIPINALLPHRLARLAGLTDARLIHLSTDCVFSGEKGNYIESDRPDADDLYGRSKLLGEVDYPNAVTLRTSILGHELDGARSLISWFLAQQGSVRGFRRAIFSGLPTVEIARVIDRHVIPDIDMRGLYHLSAEPIDKCSLLRMVAAEYGKAIEIVADDTFEIDRSLDSTVFRARTGYQPPAWPELVALMRSFN